MNSADQLLSILQLFTPERPEWTVDEASKEINVSVSTAYRYFRSLCKVGLLDRFSNGNYILGPAIIEYDRRIRFIDPLIRVARPAMQRLVTRSEHIGVALLCRIYRNCVMCVHQEYKGIPEEHLGYERGRPMPMFLGASSKIIFANLPSRSARWFFTKYHDEIANAHLGATWDEVKVNLRRIRKTGISVTHGEVDAGRVGIAAPVFASQGTVIGSITLVLLEKDATPEIVANSSALVQAAGREIDAALLHFPVGDLAEPSTRKNADAPEAESGSATALMT
ncbi:MAG: IclR family transcriptional regulator [Terriglobales bacterium]